MDRHRVLITAPGSKISLSRAHEHTIMQRVAKRPLAHLSCVWHIRALGRVTSVLAGAHTQHYSTTRQFDRTMIDVKCVVQIVYDILVLSAHSAWQSLDLEDPAPAKSSRRLHVARIWLLRKSVEPIIESCLNLWSFERESWNNVNRSAQERCAMARPRSSSVYPLLSAVNGIVRSRVCMNIDLEPVPCGHTN